MQNFAFYAPARLIIGRGAEYRLEEMARKATHECFGQEHPIGGLKKLYWQDVLAIDQLAR